MNALLVRVGADQSSGGGSWNGPVDSESRNFVYAPIPEYQPTHPGFEKPFSLLTPALARFGLCLPAHLANAHMHLDPDFAHLTYGDSGRKARQIAGTLHAGDYAVFYAGLRDGVAPRLVYAIIGILEVKAVVPATGIPARLRDFNAHSRRILAADAVDVVVVGRPGTSGRLAKCLPIAEYRDRAYRVLPDLLSEWGGLSVNDGYLQRSARIPAFLQPERFLHWFLKQQPVLMKANN